jgi:hypothetical protein
MPCPKCQFEQSAGDTECLRCGVVFARLEAASRPRFARPREAEPVSEKLKKDAAAAPGLEPCEALPFAGVRLTDPSNPEPCEPLPIEREGLAALGIGAGLLLVLGWFPFVAFILSPILTLTHELGHAAFAWLFGYPALPAFDFFYGGGLTHWAERRHGVLWLLIVGLLGAGIWRSRGHRPRMIFFGVLLALYVPLALKADWEIVLYMGHGTTLIVAGVFLYRALDGWACIYPIERPLYAFLGFFMVLHEMALAHGLMTNPAARMLYREGKGGIAHDFVRISGSLRTSLESVARFHLFWCVLVVVAAFLAHRYKGYLAEALHRLFGREA